MLRRLERAWPWNTSIYVCRTCRYTQRAAQRQQVRHETSYAPFQSEAPVDDGIEYQIPSAEDVEDSWLSNFNSLGAGSNKPKNIQKDVSRPLERKIGLGRTRRQRIAGEQHEFTKQRLVNASNSSLDDFIAKWEQPLAVSKSADRDKSVPLGDVESAQDTAAFKPFGHIEDTAVSGDSRIPVLVTENAHAKGRSPELGQTNATAEMRAQFENMIKSLEKDIATEGEIGLHEVPWESLSSDHRTVSIEPAPSSDPDESAIQPTVSSASDIPTRRSRLDSTLHNTESYTTKSFTPIPEPESSASKILIQRHAFTSSTPDNRTGNNTSAVATSQQPGSIAAKSVARQHSILPDEPTTQVPSFSIADPTIRPGSHLDENAANDVKSRGLWKNMIGKLNTKDSVPEPAISALEASSLGQSESTSTPMLGMISRASVSRMSNDPETAVSRYSPEHTVASTTRAPPFGVLPRESSEYVHEDSKPIIPGFITPTYEDRTEPSLAAQALSKLHNSGWHNSLVVSEQELSKSKPSKEKPTKKPASPRTPKTIEKGTPTRRRQRIRRVTSTSKAKVGNASSAGGSTRGEAAAKKSAPGQRKTSKSASLPGEADAGPTIPPNFASVDAKELEMTPLDIPQPPVPALQYGLDRVLFNPGVYQLQDPHSRVYNFDPYLQNIMPVVEFDYNALKEYKTSSQDVALAQLAKEHGKRYIGSTSSMTGTLGHFHYLLSAFRPINLDMLSRGFPEKLDTFTAINRAPNAIFLRWKNGSYAIDADKEYDGANVLMMLGKSMEKLLTVPTEEFERYRKSDPRAVPDEERSAPESFHYTTLGDFLMRSQLDAHDARLPGTGMFDLKTRAVLTVRMNTEDFQPMTGYQIHTLQGRFESYEREYYDMMRSTMLKYMLQVRMGRMDGIFIAFHNVERIFGFQYVSLQDMDRALHGQVNTCLGDQEFKLSLELLNKVFDMATKKFPEQSLRFHFETRNESLATGTFTTAMWIYAEPMAENDIDHIQATSKAKVAEFERTMLGLEKGDQLTPFEGTASGTESPTQDIEGNSDAAFVSLQQPSTETTAQSNDSSGADTSSPSDQDKSSTDSSASPRELAPLFVANILVQSRVNDTVVARPEKLKPSDNWQVEYIIQEWPANEQMWARYAQTKATRREALQKLDDEDDAEAEDGKESRKAKKEKGFTAFLKSMSQRGREFRDKVEQLEAGKEPVVYGRPVAGKALSSEHIEGVEDYMGWLYRKR